MKRAYDLIIKPLNEDLGRKLNIQPEKYMDVKKPIKNKALEKNVKLPNWRPF